MIPSFAEMMERAKTPEEFFKQHEAELERMLPFQQKKKKGVFRTPKVWETKPSVKWPQEGIGAEAQIACYTPGMTRRQFAEVLVQNGGPLHDWFVSLKKQHQLRKRHSEIVQKKLDEIYQAHPGKRIQDYLPESVEDRK